MILLRNIHVEQSPSGISIPVDSDLSGTITNATSPSSVIGGGIGYVFRMRGSSTNSTGAWSGAGSNWESGLVNLSTFSSNFGTLFLPTLHGTIDGVSFGTSHRKYCRRSYFGK